MCEWSRGNGPRGTYICFKSVAMLGLRKNDGWEEIETGRLRASSCLKSGEANINQ